MWDESRGGYGVPLKLKVGGASSIRIRLIYVILVAVFSFN